MPLLKLAFQNHSPNKSDFFHSFRLTCNCVPTDGWTGCVTVNMTLKLHQDADKQTCKSRLFQRPRLNPPPARNSGHIRGDRECEFPVGGHFCTTVKTGDEKVARNQCERQRVCFCGWVCFSAQPLVCLSGYVGFWIAGG